MKMEYVLAVDGGGTKTHALLCGLAGEDAVLETAEGTNHEYLAGGFDEVRRRLRDLFARISETARRRNAVITHSVWGMAGLDTMVQHRILSDILRDVGVDSFTLANDSYLGIKAGTKRGYGVCLINGTGANTVGINHLGRRFQMGGQQELTGDFGGGQIFGYTAIATVYRNLFCDNLDTALNKLMFDFYGITSKYELMEHVMEGIHNGRAPVPRLAKLVFEAANMGDPQAVGMLRRMGRTYAQNIGSLVKELAFPDEEIEVVLAGSLFTKEWSGIHVQALRDKLCEDMPERRFSLDTLKAPPVIGALIWALENAGCERACEIGDEVMADCFPEAALPPDAHDALESV